MAHSQGGRSLLSIQDTAVAVLSSRVGGGWRSSKTLRDTLCDVYSVFLRLGSSGQQCWPLHDLLSGLLYSVDIVWRESVSEKAHLCYEITSQSPLIIPKG